MGLAITSLPCAFYEEKKKAIIARLSVSTRRNTRWTRCAAIEGSVRHPFIFVLPFFMVHIRETERTLAGQITFEDALLVPSIAFREVAEAR